MKIISISGLDGSGKSTQIEMLKTYLESQGKKVFYFHATAFSIANKKSSENSQPGKSVTKASWLKIQLRKLALVIDLFRFNSFKKDLEKQGYDYLLSDRYFYDTIINIAYLSNSTLPPNSYNLIPTPDFVFFLNTDPEKIMSRDRVPDQGLEYLKIKRDLLETFAKENNLTIIDGNRDKEIIHSEIREKTGA